MTTLIKAQPQQESIHSPHWVREHLKSAAYMLGVALPLDLTEHLSHKAMLPSPRDIAVLSNMWKQTQGGRQNEETKKHVANKRAEPNSKKRIRQMETSNALNP